MSELREPSAVRISIASLLSHQNETTHPFGLLARRGAHFGAQLSFVDPLPAIWPMFRDAAQNLRRLQPEANKHAPAVFEAFTSTISASLSVNEGFLDTQFLRSEFEYEGCR